MNKKVALSVLSTAVVASMAASAFAAPLEGVYVGGNVKKYYHTDTLFEMTKDARAQYKAHLKAVGEENIVFVDHKGKGASIQEIFDKGKSKAFEEQLKKEDFADLYQVVKPDGTTSGTEDAKSKVDPAPTGDLKVESVSAINKTKIEVKFNKAVDSIKAENFAIEGAVVKSATLSEDKKTASLEVSGLDYKKTYNLVAKDVLVEGKEVEDITKSFTTPAVTDLWNLQVTPKSPVLKADGSDNTVITFNLIDKTTGAVDKNADDVVIALSTTQGNLAKSRATIQDGTATVVLTSEFSAKDLVAKIDAQIIEASGDYKDLIGQVVGTTNVKFSFGGGTVEAINLLSADSNQADRVTLFFDKDVDLATVVKTTPAGELLYLVTAADGTVTEMIKADIPKNTPAKNIAHSLRENAVKVSQGGKDVKVQGVKPVTGNTKALEVILAKQASVKDPILTDNQEVAVDVVTTNSLGKETKSDFKFNLTDARDPETTSVTPEGLNTLKVKFSEAINKATFKIDGRFNETEAFTTEYGDFNPATLEDNRDLVTIKLTKGYDEDGPNKNDTVPGFFTAGKHALQISSIYDFAAVTDENNIGTTQTLGFEISADPSAPTAQATVESAEQIRVKFNKTIDKDLEAKDFELQYYDAEKKEYRAVTDADVGADKLFKLKPELTVDPISNTEYVLELTQDWTRIFKTKETKVNYYNHKFRIHIAKGAVANASNGVKNETIYLDLNHSGSPLNTPDTTSPTIKSIEKVGKDLFVVTTDKPVKLRNTEKFQDASETLNEDQSVTPETSVQFYGKDKDGVTKTVDGVVGKYVDGNGADMKFEVTAPLQRLVDEEGYSEDWKMAVKSLSDDVGNTLVTKDTDFKVTKSATADTPFFIETVVGHLNGEDEDTITITFSEGVQHKGEASDATNPSQYTLNGKKTPSGTSISVEDRIEKNKGFETVVIKLPNGTLLKAGNNIITVNKDLQSHDNTILTRGYDKAINVLDTDANNAAAAQAVDTKIAALPAVNALTLADEAKVQAARADYNALTAAQKALVTKAADLQAAEAKIAELKAGQTDAAAAQAVDTKIAALPAVNALTLADEAKVQAARADYDALTAAQKALVTKAADLQAAEAKIAELKAGQTDAAAAQAVDAKITALPAVNALTLADEAAVQAARADYDALTAAQKALVTKAADLQAAEAKIAELKAEKAALEAAKTALNNAITVAQGTHDGATEGTATGEYAVGSKATLQAEIDKAQLVADNTNATKAELDTAKSNLDAAVATFEAGKVS